MEILNKKFEFMGFEFEVIKDNRKPSGSSGWGTVTLEYDDSIEIMGGQDWKINFPKMKTV